jgi:aryl-alcohol dehydrogenase-like predicted oxidoreductase
MNYRPLGQTGLRVSEIGFGAWGIGGTADGAVAYGPTDDRESERALRRALDLGITFFDTAALYGNGHSESLLGAALHGARDKVVLASKAGYLDAGGRQDFSPGHLRSSLEQSLKRLRTDVLDLYQLHDPPMDLLAKADAILDTMQALKAEGKIRAVGITVKTPADGLRAVREFGAQAVQVNFSMIDQRALESGLLDLCASVGVGVIGRTPLCFGFLTGAYPPGTAFHPRDHRSTWPKEQVDRWATAYTKFEAALRLRRGETRAQAAIRYCLSYPALSAVIPGMLTAAEVEENAGASARGPLGDGERIEVERIYRQNEFFVKA